MCSVFYVCVVHVITCVVCVVYAQCICFFKYSAYDHIHICDLSAGRATWIYIVFKIGYMLEDLYDTYMIICTCISQHLCTIYNPSAATYVLVPEFD